MNRVELIGYLGNDARVHETKNGTPICNLRLATQERRKNKDNAWISETTWHTVTCFGTIAERCSKYGVKGAHVRIEARLRYTPLPGTRHQIAMVTATHIDFLGTKPMTKKNVPSTTFSVDDSNNLRCNTGK